MVDRAARRWSGFCLVLMLAADFWRIALTDHAITATTSAFLVLPPICLGIVAVSMLRNGKHARIAGERPQPLQEWSAGLVVPYALIMTLLEAGMLGVSLDIRLPLRPIDISRTAMITIALLLMLAGNRLPKLPWHTLGASHRGARQPRVIARLLVAVGVADMLAVLVFHQPWSMTIAVLAVNFVFLAWMLAARKQALRSGIP